MHHFETHTTHTHCSQFIISCTHSFSLWLPLIGFTHEYPLFKQQTIHYIVSPYSASANCHVLYKGLCAVAPPAIRQNVSSAFRGFETRQNLREVRLNSGTCQSQKIKKKIKKKKKKKSNSSCVDDECNNEAVMTS